MRNWDAPLLDPTGNTIPPTYHAPDDPDSAVFMSMNGDDKNDGRSDMRPVKTLNRAIEVAPNNGTVCFRGGTYNDNYRNADGTYRILANKFLTFTSYLGEPVTFDGANRLHHLLVCGSNAGVGMHAFKGFEITRFVGGWEGQIGDVPLYLGDGQGAWFVVEDMLIHKNGGVGINMSDPRGDLGDCRVNRNVFCDNGSNGMTDTGSQKIKPGTYPTADHDNDLWVSNNYFGRNNLANNQHPYEGGFKLHNNKKVTLFGNIIEDTIGNYGHGGWTDVANNTARYLCNFVRYCGSSGLFDEVGELAWFVSNVLIDNGLETNHANIRVACKHPRIWYNTSVVTGDLIRGKKAYIPIEIYDDVRNIQTDGYGPDTDDVELSSNLFAGGLGRYAFLMYLYSNQPPHAGGGTWPSQFWDSHGHFGPNAWAQMLSNGDIVRWSEKGQDIKYKNFATMQQQKGVGAGQLITNGDPFKDHVSWRTNTTSPLYALGEPLPADIATALGYKAGQRFPFGYIDCPIPKSHPGL